MEAIKYVATTIGVVLSTIVIVFSACFGAWLFERWRNER